MGRCALHLRHEDVKTRFSPYFETQKQQGHSVLFALCMLPFAILRPYYHKAFPEKNCAMHGWGLHDLPLLASYSRSGANCIRFIIEDISGRPTDI